MFNSFALACGSEAVNDISGLHSGDAAAAMCSCFFSWQPPKDVLNL